MHSQHKFVEFVPKCCHDLIKTGTRSIIWYCYKGTHTHTHTLAYIYIYIYIYIYTQHKWIKLKPSIFFCLANRQIAKLFVEYSSTRRKKERSVSTKSAIRDRKGDGTDGKRRRTSNARRNEKPDGRTGKSGEQCATKRENGTAGAKTSGRWRATKQTTVRARRKRRVDGARRNWKPVRMGRKRRAGSARRVGKPGWYWRKTVNYKRGGGKNNASRPQQQTQPNKLPVTPEQT